jgi:hypothetical protein
VKEQRLFVALAQLSAVRRSILEVPPGQQAERSDLDIGPINTFCESGGEVLESPDSWNGLRPLDDLKENEDEMCDVAGRPGLLAGMQK